MRKVLVAGYFDPLHDGHLDHIMKAAKIGDFLYIVTHTDAATERDKGARFTTVIFRHFMLQAILHELRIPGAVLVIDDATVAGVIRQFKPDIFAKGGDRIPGNMPQAEIEACAAVKCSIVYGIGDQLNSSSEIKALLGGKT